MKTRFTYRSLYREKRDREKQSVWSAAPNSDDLDELRALRKSLERQDLRVLVGRSEEEEAAAFIRRQYPEVARVRFDFEPPDVRIDDARHLLYVDIDAHLVALDTDGRELHTTEYDYYARQVAMDALERQVG